MKAKITLGEAELKHGVVLAPMAGFSDRAMRLVCHEAGAELTVTEMISAKAVVYGDKKTARLARIGFDEGRVALQMFGSEPSVMAEAAEILTRPIDNGASPVALDINMGCPVPKVYGNGEGSALMKSPALIYDIVRAVKQATPLPVTVKLRLGIDRSHINASECALAAQEGGAELIALHGRTRVEMYAGEADMEEIAKVKNNLHIPLIANGDIASFCDVERVLSVTGADGVMIGRAAIGNPFLFSEIISGFEGAEYVPPTDSQRAERALYQLRLAIEDKGEQIAVREARKQIALYFRSFRGAAELRAEINRAQTLAEVENALTKCLGI